MQGTNRLFNQKLANANASFFPRGRQGFGRISAVLGGGHVIILSEHPIEGAQVIEPAIEGDLGDRSLPVSQAGAGKGEAVEHEKVQNRGARDLLDAVGKIVLGNAAMIGKIIQRDRLVVMLGDVIVYPTKQGRSSRTALALLLR